MFRLWRVKMGKITFTVVPDVDHMLDITIPVSQAADLALALASDDLIKKELHRRGGVKYSKGKNDGEK